MWNESVSEYTRVKAEPGSGLARLARLSQLLAAGEFCSHLWL